MNHQTQRPHNILPATWFGRLITALIATALAVAGLFFVAFALIAAAIVAAIFIARIWWVSRKLHAQRGKDVIEGSYSVEVEQTQTIPSENTSSGTLPPLPK